MKNAIQGEASMFMAKKFTRRGRQPIAAITPSQMRTLRAVRDLMARQGYPPSIQELADAIGIKAPTAHNQVGHLVRKGYLKRNPNKARGLSVLRNPDSEVSNLIRVPILGEAAAGNPIAVQENVIGEILVEAKVVRNRRYFAIKIRGDSMEQANIRNGDLVVVRQQPVAENGDIVVALLDGHATVKRLHISDDQIELRPEHPRHRPIPVGPEDDLRILGKVVAVRRMGAD